MASRSVSLVKGWLAANCPTMPALVTGRAQFVVHVNDGSEIKTERLYLRSANASWSSAPFYEAVLAAATSSGAALVNELATSKADSIVLHREKLLVGPTVGVNSMRRNDAIAHSTFKVRYGLAVRDYRNGFAGNPSPSTFNAAGMSLEQASLHPIFSQAKRILALAGVTVGDVQELKIANSAALNPSMTTNYPTQTLLLEKHGPGKLFVGVGQTSAVGPTHRSVFYMVGDRPDDSVGYINLFADWTQSESYISNNTTNPPRTSWNTESSGVDPSLRPDWWVQRDAIKANLLTSYDVNGAVNIDSLTALDHPWLPLVYVPRDQTYMVASDFADVIITSEIEEDYDVITVTHSRSTSIGAVPIKWYTEYAEAEIAKGASNKVELQKAIDSLVDYADGVITYAEMPTPVMLPVDMITFTTTYRDYAKAKEKACEDNDFMSRQFTDDMTFGALNTKINGSRNTKVFYGYRDSGELDVLEVDLKPASDVTIAVGTSTVYAVRAGSTVATFTASNVEDFIQWTSEGAKVTGGTVSTQLALWGYSATDYESVLDGLQESKDRVQSSNTYGTSAALYDFRWGSLGVSGYPLYDEVDQQTGYRIAMVSKGILAGIGKRMRDVQLGSIMQSAVRKKYPTIA